MRDMPHIPRYVLPPRAAVAELADALDSKSSSFGSVGSSPSSGTIFSVCPRLLRVEDLGRARSAEPIDEILGCARLAFSCGEAGEQGDCSGSRVAFTKVDAQERGARGAIRLLRSNARRASAGWRDAGPCRGVAEVRGGLRVARGALEDASAPPASRVRVACPKPFRARRVRGARRPVRVDSLLGRPPSGIARWPC